MGISWGKNDFSLFYVVLFTLSRTMTSNMAIDYKTPLSPPLSPSPEHSLSPLSPPSPPLSPSPPLYPLYGCREILYGSDGVINLVIKNNRVYFSYTSRTKNNLCKRLKSKRQLRRKQPYHKEKVIYKQEKEEPKDELDFLIFKLHSIQIKE